MPSILRVNGFVEEAEAILNYCYEFSTLANKLILCQYIPLYINEA